MTSKKYIPLGECKICSELEDFQRADQKHGWPEGDTFLPNASSKLKPDPTEQYKLGSRFTLIQRCPKCGIPYKYRLDYDYCVTGSEDEEILTRLTPTDIKDDLTDKEYDWWMTNLKKDLKSKDEKTRDYAKKCIKASKK